MPLNAVRRKLIVAVHEKYVTACSSSYARVSGGREASVPIVTHNADILPAGVSVDNATGYFHAVIRAAIVHQNVLYAAKSLSESQTAATPGCSFPRYTPG